MKKMYFLLMLVGSLLIFSQTSIAQKSEKLTSKTATVNKGYSIINAGEAITIYKYVHRAHSPKEAEKYEPKYFFTTSASEILQPLTLENLKKAFPNNHPFHDALDATFKGDKELTSYDNFHKMYKVNWLLKQHP
ncbi:hypothetical protein A3860_22965 [Niastella vici]|uniref:Uncharacterized protein n=1 Tax=Niastella vici TaxID=1703345 RepID=A0A1V9FZN0_9BACT|nr:hypothetical protein [Niastella vici]OQP63803.1 hypothetical protein A3860_22965 [Niastella vici]